VAAAAFCAVNLRATSLRRSLQVACASLALSGGLPAAFAANDVVLRLNSTTASSSIVAGESTVANHVGEIDVLSFTWGVVRPSSTTTTSGSGTANAQALTITKRLDKSSASLMVGVFQGTRYPTAVLFVRNQGANPLDFFKITLTDVIAVSYNSTQGGGEGVVESVSLTFGTIKFDYQAQNPDGTAAGGLITGGWDITRNVRL
jgi:type VI secretion system secreted protein Hcp